MKYIRFLTILLALSCGFTPTINAMKKKTTKKKRRRNKRNNNKRNNNKQSLNRPLIAEKKFIPNINQFLPKNANDSARLEKVQLWLNATSFQSRVIGQLRIFADILPILSETRTYVMTKDGKLIEGIITSHYSERVCIEKTINGDNSVCELYANADTGACKPKDRETKHIAFKIFTPEGIVSLLSFMSLLEDQKSLQAEIAKNRDVENEKYVEVAKKSSSIPKICETKLLYIYNRCLNRCKTDLMQINKECLNQLYEKFQSVPEGEPKSVMGYILHQFYSSEFIYLLGKLPMGIKIWRNEKSKLSLFDCIAKKENVNFLKSLPHFEKSCDIMEQLFLNYDDVNNQDGDEGKYNRFVADKMNRVVSMILDFLHDFGNYGEVLQNTYSHVHTYINRLISRSKVPDKRIIREYKKNLKDFFSDYGTGEPVPESIIFNSEKPVQKNPTVITNVAKKHVTQKKQQQQKKSLPKNGEQVSNNVNVKEEISTNCPDEKNISAENSDYKTSITYDRRVSDWYNKDFARTQSLEDYYHHCFSPLVAKYIIKYGKRQQRENIRYKNKKDNYYVIFGEREYTVKNKKEFVAFNCCLDPKGILYHQEANKKKANSLFNEYSKLLDEHSKFSYWFQMQYPTIQESVQMKEQAKAYKLYHTEDEFGSKVIEENDHCIKIWDNILEMKITLYKLPYAQS